MLWILCNAGNREWKGTDGTGTWSLLTSSSSSFPSSPSSSSSFLSPLPPPLTHSLPNLTGRGREDTGHSPPPLPIFWQRPPRQQSQSTQDMGEKTTDSSVRLDWEQHSSHVSSAESPVGLDLLLIQHKRVRRNKLTDFASFLFSHFAEKPVRRCLLASSRMWGCHLCRHLEKEAACSGRSWPNVGWWWPRKSSSRCRPLRGWTAAGSTTTSSTWWPIRWELVSSSTAGVCLRFFQCQFSF